MPIITFIEHDGTEHAVAATTGQTVMQAAVDNLIPSILGQCGGDCTCGTCHCYVDGEWADRIAAAADDEKAMLEFTLGVQQTSRLSCQIVVSEQIEGIVLRLPQSQL
ncbi:MAG: 2Fe-2S iron-sulfur cluster-binding protein [Pseudomonadota bacterium]